MSRLKLGDIIKCTSKEELSEAMEELVKARYGFITSYDMMTMTWKIKIIDIREAADDKCSRDSDFFNH